MVHTFVSLESEETTWHGPKTKEKQISTAELIRRVAQRFREENESEAHPLRQQLQETSGIWKDEDGLSFQLRVREEWDDRLCKG